MRYLLDTNILMWTFASPSRLTMEIRDLMTNPNNKMLFSTVSIWEIGIKAALKRSDFDFDPQDILDSALRSGISELSIDSKLAILASRLPLHHRDPFDRMLVAQAMNEPARLLTSDAMLARYSELVDVI